MFIICGDCAMRSVCVKLYLWRICIRGYGEMNYFYQPQTFSAMHFRWSFLWPLIILTTTDLYLTYDGGIFLIGDCPIIVGFTTRCIFDRNYFYFYFYFLYIHALPLCAFYFCRYDLLYVLSATPLLLNVQIYAWGAINQYIRTAGLLS